MERPPDRSALLLGGPSLLVELRFDRWARHPDTGEALAVWVKRLPGREWVPARKSWWVPAADLASGVLSAAGFSVLDRAGRRLRRRDGRSEPRQPAATEIPDWFGLDLAAYQRDGALAVVGGRWLLADPPGLGKTRQCLAVAALAGATRSVIVCPPVVLAHWEHEAGMSGIATHPDPAGKVVVVRAGRKQPPLPACGVVIVADTLLAARQVLADELCAWAPDLLVVDEAHRAKTWDSIRSKTIRMLAAASTWTVASTGTPMFASPYELAPILEATGQLREVWGGASAYLERYTTKNRYNKVVARKHRLGELGATLDERVWVRRRKTEVLADLPPKTRRALYVEVDESIYRAAHAAVTAEIDQAVTAWAASGAGWPSEDKIWAWCAGRLELITRLRRAAGIAKVPAAAEIVAEWVQASERLADGGYASPVVIWTHHRPVSEAMVAAAGEALRPGAGRQAPVGAILGGTPDDERARLVDKFAAGRLGALVCSITAAGVGITLNRSSDALFVETDWTPALVTQAEDRIWRIGQTEAVAITTLVAPGTLDEAIQSTLRRKARNLDKVMAGGDHHVEVAASSWATGAALLAEMVSARIAAHDEARSSVARRRRKAS